MTVIITMFTMFTDIAALLRVQCIKIALAKRNCKTGHAITTLKPKQIDAVENLLDGYDVVAVLPTGYGKSLIFELLPEVYHAYETAMGRTPKPCHILVVSPLNSIINEQKHRYADSTEHQ